MLTLARQTVGMILKNKLRLLGEKKTRFLQNVFMSPRRKTVLGLYRFHLLVLWSSGAASQLQSRITKGIKLLRCGKDRCIVIYVSQFVIYMCRKKLQHDVNYSPKFHE